MIELEEDKAEESAHNMSEVSDIIGGSEAGEDGYKDEDED